MLDNAIKGIEINTIEGTKDMIHLIPSKSCTYPEPR